MHKINDENAEHFKELVLFPDYTSSGIWCSCGLGLGNPKDELNLSDTIVDLIQFWNDYWDMASTGVSNKSIDKEATENLEKEIINIGRILMDKVAKFIPCELLEERCKLNIVNHN
jgi:hypothetical protein